MTRYIYGEQFIKTNKNLFFILSYNHIQDKKVYYTVYKKVNGYNTKSNSFYHADGNVHIKNSASCFQELAPNHASRILKYAKIKQRG